MERELHKPVYPEGYPKPTDEAGHRFNLADVLSYRFGPTHAAMMLRRFADDECVGPTLTTEYHAALYSEAARLEGT